MKKGFSLIELMVVIAIIAVISAIAVPSYQKYIVRAKVLKSFNILRAFSDTVALRYQQTGVWPSSVTWGETTFTNGNQIAASSTLQANNIYYGEYAANGNVAAFFFSVSGLNDISGYEDPQTSGNAFFSKYSLLSIRVKDTGMGVLVTQCGTGTPDDLYYVPLSYQPSICTCEYLNDYFGGGTNCTP